VKPARDVRVLHMSIMASKEPKKIFQYHIDHGADVNTIDKTLGTPLMVAIREGADLELAKFVVELGGDVAITNSAGSALHNAVEFGTPELIDYLIEHGADKILNYADSRGYTPLILAASVGNDTNLEHLITKHKVDPNFQTDVTALLMATQNRKISTTHLLIKYGADVDATHTKMQCTALHLAASNEFLDIVEILCQAGCKVDCEDPRGYTPMLMAATEGYVKCVEMLLKAGADPNHRAHSDHTTTIFHSAAKNRIGVVHLLLKYGADCMSTRHENGETIEEVARKEGRILMADLLKSWMEAPPEERYQICHVCYKFKHGTMKRCGACKKVWYCSVACQTKDWQSSHKVLCGKNL